MVFSKREQRTVLLVGVLALGILWLYTASIITPLMREASTLGQQVRSAREELRAMERATANEVMLRQQHRNVERAVLSLRELLPSDEELPTSIEFLSELARQSNLKIQAIFPQRREDSEPAPSTPAADVSAYTEVPIQIDALAGYHQLGSFISLIESSQRPMRLSSLRVSSNPKEPRWHLVKLVIDVYFATTETTIPERPS